MKTLKQILIKMPELYLIVLILLSSFSDKLHLNPIAIGLIVILILQIVFKNKASGIVIASLFIIMNLYMLAAVTSEFNEFPVINAEAQKLRAVGFLLFVFNSTMAGMMLYKYIIKKKGAQELLLIQV